MNDHNAPDACTESDDCDHSIHTRTHDRNSRLESADANEDAPEVEHVCPVHGVIESSICAGSVEDALDVDLSMTLS